MLLHSTMIVYAFTTTPMPTSLPTMVTLIQAGDNSSGNVNESLEAQIICLDGFRPLSIHDLNISATG